MTQGQGSRDPRREPIGQQNPTSGTPGACCHPTRPRVPDHELPVMSESLATIIAAGITAAVALYRWHRDRETKALGLYVMPLLHAAEDLQSRIYNAMRKDGLVPLLDETLGKDRETALAHESLYLIGVYCGWERIACQHGPFVRDKDFILAVKRVRRAFASDRKVGVDPCCIFRSLQSSLGAAAVQQAKGGGSDPLYVTASMDSFLKRVRKAPHLRALLIRWEESFRTDTPGVFSKWSPSGRRLGVAQEKLRDLVHHLEARGKVSVSELAERKSVFKEGSQWSHPKRRSLSKVA